MDVSCYCCTKKINVLTLHTFERLGSTALVAAAAAFTQIRQLGPVRIVDDPTFLWLFNKELGESPAKRVGWAVIASRWLPCKTPVPLEGEGCNTQLFNSLCILYGRCIIFLHSVWQVDVIFMHKAWQLTITIFVQNVPQLNIYVQNI